MWYVLEAMPISTAFDEAAIITKSNISYELAGSNVIFKYEGIKPTINIKVEMIFTPKERRIESFSLTRGGSVFLGPNKLMFYDGCTWDEWCEHGVTLNNLYTIDKKSDQLIRVYETVTRFFEIPLFELYPQQTTYDVSNASGYGAAEPE